MNLLKDELKALRATILDKIKNIESYDATTHQLIPMTASTTGFLQIYPGIRTKLCFTSEPAKTIVNVTFDKGATLLPHYHPEWEYLYVLVGEIEDIYSGTCFKEGEVCKISSMVPHQIHSSTGAKLTVTYSKKDPSIS